MTRKTSKTSAAADQPSTEDTETTENTGKTEDTEADRPPENTVVENTGWAPIELQLPTGRCVLPARGRLVVARDLAADGLLLRLVAQGAVRMSPERNS